jgi:hypothetical protein
MSFLLKLIEPLTVLMLFVWIYCLIGNVYLGYREKGAGYLGFASIMWLICGILALVSWFIRLFS